MNRCEVLTWLLCCGVGLCGCSGFRIGGKPYAGLGEAREIIERSVEWLGGYDAWKNVTKVVATAIVTVYDENGTAFTNRQHQRIDVHEGKIYATAQAGEGRWEATACRNGRCRIRSEGFVPEAKFKKQTSQALTTLADRLPGPLALINFRGNVLSTAPVRLGGEDLIRVELRDTGGKRKGYYFDATSGELRFVTSVSESGESRDTVTAYTFMMLPNGLAFPRKIQVFRQGENVILGKQPILEAEYSDVEVHRFGWICTVNMD